MGVKISLSKARVCPICRELPKGLPFPYETRFNDIHFHYLKCGECKSVFVSPVPDAQTFSLIYGKSAYHDIHYSGSERANYSKSAGLLRQYVMPGSIVLDYGCGMGGILKSCSIHDLLPFGEEFDGEAALFAEKNANSVVI